MTAAFFRARPCCRGIDVLDVLPFLKPAHLFSLLTVSSVVHLCTRCSCSMFSLLGCALWRGWKRERERSMQSCAYINDQIKSNHFYCHITTAQVPWWVNFLRACSRQCKKNKKLHMDSTYYSHWGQSALECEVSSIMMLSWQIWPLTLCFCCLDKSQLSTKQLNIINSVCSICLVLRDLMEIRLWLFWLNSGKQLM